MEKMLVKVYFVEELLGSCPSQKDIYAEYIAGKGPNAKKIEEEIAALGEEAVEKKGTTVFLRRKDGTPTLSNHTWLGYFKEKVKYLRQKDDSPCKKFTAYKGKIDGNFMILENFTDLTLPEGGEISVLQRPLRGDTAQGPIVSLASSECAPAGTSCEFTLAIDAKEFVKYAIECFDKGIFNGTGQWRSGGKGRFLYEVRDPETGEITECNTKEYLGVTSDDEGFLEALNTFIEERKL